MSKNHVTDETIHILEQEGLGEALNETARVLSGHGLEKHGPRHWAQHGKLYLLTKAFGHLNKPTLDKDSGLPHMAHGVARSLMAFAKQLGEAAKKPQSPL